MSLVSSWVGRLMIRFGRTCAWWWFDSPMASSCGLKPGQLAAAFLRFGHSDRALVNGLNTAMFSVRMGNWYLTCFLGTPLKTVESQFGGCKRPRAKAGDGAMWNCPNPAADVAHRLGLLT